MRLPTLGLPLASHPGGGYPPPPSLLQTIENTDFSDEVSRKVFHSNDLIVKISIRKWLREKTAGLAVIPHSAKPILRFVPVIPANIFLSGPRHLNNLVGPWAESTQPTSLPRLPSLSSYEGTRTKVQR